MRTIPMTEVQTISPAKHLSVNINMKETTTANPKAARSHCQFYI